MDFPLIWAAANDAVASGITLSTILNFIWCVFLVLIGVNMLIIVHEFGHFIVARMCGVRCDKFYIWFDIYGWKIFKFKWGDTEYGLGVLPLGGYVKMLGQEDSPGAIKAEIERAKLAAQAVASDEGLVARDFGTSHPPPAP
ncbi:MAG: site-2 protease family protein, partial [Planctomycetaceae bacterium]|nr:site-2 protease family protein [Planctomycetaceae bacterium]